MKNLYPVQSAMDEIIHKLHMADDWRTSAAYKKVLREEVAAVCERLGDAAYDLGVEIAEELEGDQ